MAVQFKNIDNETLNYLETKSEIMKRYEYAIEKRRIYIELLLRDMIKIRDWLGARITSSGVSDLKISELEYWLESQEGNEMYINLDNYA